MTEAELRRNRRRKQARSRHTNRYWQNHDKETYLCPDCGRGIESVWRFEVHHIDENPLNGDPDNLIALCFECHRRRHGQEPKRESLEDWKGRIEDLGSKEKASYALSSAASRGESA